MASEPADVCNLLPASKNVEYYASCFFVLCKILGFHHGVGKVVALLRCYTVLVGS